MADWFCYMVRCKDYSLYVGIANDVAERVKRHNWGVAAQFTAKRRPVELVWSERYGSVQEARAREKEIKGWSRNRKLELMQADSSVKELARPTACPERAKRAKDRRKPGNEGDPLKGSR